MTSTPRQPPTDPHRSADRDPVENALRDLRNPHDTAWVFCATGSSQEETFAWHAVELGLGFLDVNNIDKAIYWFDFAARQGYPGARLVHQATDGLRQALFTSEVDHLTGDEAEPGAGLHEAKQTLVDSLVDAAQQVADALIGKAKAEAQAIINKARAQAPHRRHGQTTRGDLH